MRLGIDLDGVVANFTQGWMNLYNKQFGTDLRFEDSLVWGDMLMLTHFSDMDEFWEWSSDHGGHSLFWYLEPFPGAVEALHSLSEDGHHIVILTMKPDFAIDDTHRWIERHRVPTDEVHILEDKWRVDCHVYLDDSPEVLPELARHRPDRTVVRYVRPWNRPVDGVVDVAGFEEFQDLVSGLARDSPA